MALVWLAWPDRLAPTRRTRRGHLNSSHRSGRQHLLTTPALNCQLNPYTFLTMSCSTGWLSARGDAEPAKPSAVEKKKRPSGSQAKGKSLRPTGGSKHRKEDRRDIAKSLLRSCLGLRDKIRNQMVISSVRQPDTLVKDRQLRPHQLIGLEWCLALWLSGANGILAGKEFDHVAWVRCSPCFASVHSVHR